ncbi:ABC transporter substrate-binding protein [Pseudonocardia sp.]|uniref:ABC transporter substrate-binding protein n=1 Tax=Pseudonocardia sp. TaxID=60912 RepID=UPI0026352243|nr:ABC transporter substrate-binding protein [Pseudonocardia sp.]MCW2721476.1 sugar transporter substrate-binding protein [Pseudonocardia sp.]
MSRPSSEAQYLAGLTPTSVAATRIGRRSLLKGAMTGAGLLGATGLLAACGSGGSTGATDVANASGALSFGSNQSDAVPKKAYESLVKGFNDPAVQITTNTIDHNTFQENINNYLQGQPDDVFTWFAGYRMRFFAQQGLVGDISDVWSGINGMTDAQKQASTADDGKQYFVPFDYYPWAVYYRPSVFAAKGYTVPKTLDEFVALNTRMQKDGLTPIAFGDKDGWPAMGTFDQLNLRINGYRFHIDLMAGKQAWDSPQVKNVFDTWKRLLPFHQPASLGRTWQEAAQTLQQKKAGTYILGMFLGQQFTPGADLDDLDFFGFPEIDTTVGTDAVEAPIDGFMMAARPKNEAAAKKFLGYLATGPAENTYLESDSTVIGTNSSADTAKYTKLQKKAVEYISSAKSISQFMDRDTRPDFASTVMIPAIQQFIGNPNDIDGLTKSIESQKKSIFTS